MGAPHENGHANSVGGDARAGEWMVSEAPGEGGLAEAGPPVAGLPPAALSPAAEEGLKELEGELEMLRGKMRQLGELQEKKAEEGRRRLAELQRRLKSMAPALQAVGNGVGHIKGDPEDAPDGDEDLPGQVAERRGA
uniref:Uncharacterized protein n=1 Tax=Hemiselmis tepida TaxID=464990 RepID=A0A7S0VR39_9CRYP